MGAAIGGIGNVAGGSGPLKDAVAGVARAVAADGTRVGGMLQQIAGSLTATLAEGEKAGKAGGAAGGGAKQALQSFQSDLTRLAYIAALQKAISKAGGQGHFNVETAVNDLWVALDAVRKGNKATILQSQMQQQTQLLETMSNMMKKMHDTAGSVIQNMR